jgi:hypothetical protein
LHPVSKKITAVGEIPNVSFHSSVLAIDGRSIRGPGRQSDSATLRL